MPPLIEHEAIQQIIASDLLFRVEAHVIWGAIEKQTSAKYETAPRWRAARDPDITPLTEL